MRTIRSIPQYTTILGQVIQNVFEKLKNILKVLLLQAMSPCGNMFAAATVDGQICVWKTSQLLAVEKGKPIVRQGY